MEREGDHVLLPCGHVGYCGACERRLILNEQPTTRVCPMCRGGLEAAVKIPLDTLVGSRGVVLEAFRGRVLGGREAHGRSRVNRPKTCRVRVSGI